MTTSAISAGTLIVPEVLIGKENYKKWSGCIKNYLLAQDLWDIIETSMEPPKLEDDDEVRTVEFKHWRKKNAATLHAIQMSCGTNILSEIEGISSAKTLWHKLDETYDEHPLVQAGRVNLRLPSADGSNLHNTRYIIPEYEDLYYAVREGNQGISNNFIPQHPDSVRAKNRFGQTALQSYCSPF